MGNGRKNPFSWNTSLKVIPFYNLAWNTSLEIPHLKYFILFGLLDLHSTWTVPLRLLHFNYSTPISLKLINYFIWKTSFGHQWEHIRNLDAFCYAFGYFSQKLCSIKGRFPSNIIFHQRSSSIRDHLLSKVVFHQSLSSIKWVKSTCINIDM